VNGFSQNKLQGNGPALPSIREAVPLFEDVLNSGMSLRVRVTGSSMAPFLAGGETLTIQKVPLSSLKKGDLVFFKTSRGAPLLHRVVRTMRAGGELVVQTQGDAAAGPDEPFRSADFLGKARMIEKDGDPRFRPINLEAPFRRTINYLRALNSLVKSHLRFAALRLFGRLLLRRNGG
jgi:hypothetical protein